jgi:hypothetical protein
MRRKFMTQIPVSRRYLMATVLGGMVAKAAAAQEGKEGPRSAQAPAADRPQIAKEMTTLIKHIDAGVLNVAYAQMGPPAGWPVVLLHGFPYDIHAYDEVAPLLAAEGARVIVPYLRAYGPTRFLSASTPRSGQQGALGADLLALLDALDIR